jgi:hypothetical protein
VEAALTNSFMNGDYISLLALLHFEINGRSPPESPHALAEES